MNRTNIDGLFDGIDVVDLSYSVWQDTPREKPIGPVKIYPTTSLEKEGYFESRVDMSGHCSTHIDASSLMYEDGDMADEIPMQRLIGKSRLIDLTFKEPGDIISKEDILEWEKANTRICEGDILFLYTGMEREFGKLEYNEKWIGISGACAEYLAGKGIKVIGTDSCNIDGINSNENNHPAHHTLLKNNVTILEDLRNLDNLPATFPVVIAPLKLCDSSGAPARVIAFIPREG